MHFRHHGYAFYWGTSEWTAQEITEGWDVAHRLDLVGRAMEQPESNLLAREKMLKTAILPRVHALALKTSVAAVRVNALLCLGELVQRLDRDITTVHCS